VICAEDLTQVEMVEKMSVSLWEPWKQRTVFMSEDQVPRLRDWVREMTYNLQCE
jgi:hypothetical protein